MRYPSDAVPVCATCAYLNHADERAGTPTCAPFPDGIPDEIYDGGTHDAIRGDEVVALTYVRDPDLAPEFDA